MIVLRRFDAVLEPTKQKALDMKKNLDAAGITEQDEALCSVAGGERAPRQTAGDCPFYGTVSRGILWAETDKTPGSAGFSEKKTGSGEETTMRGYFTANGFYGLVGDTYVLFSEERDYYEFLEEEAA